MWIFFENTVNTQRTCGVVVEQMIAKQYRVRYGNNQYTKVSTVNMVLANSASLKVDPKMMTSTKVKLRTQV